MRIGIGIPTYNRLDSLKETVESIRAYADIEHDLCVVVDGSSDGTVDWLVDENINHIFHQENRGVCYAKNDILQKFRDYDYTFIIEDDVKLIKHGLFALYIRAIAVFHIQHWNFLAPWQRHPTKPNLTKDGLTMMFSNDVGATVSVFTREVIEKVGGRNPEFHGYGYDHCEYTLRAHRAGLTTGWQEFAHLVDAEEYIELLDIPCATSKEEKERDKKRNIRVLRETHANKNLIYLPLEKSCSISA